MYHKLLLFFGLALCLGGQIRAQEQKLNRDSLRITQDSVKVVHDSLKVTQDSLTFKAIEKYSLKSKFTRFIHGLFFKHVTPDDKQPSKKNKIKKTKGFRKAEGKFIREIYITTLNPFGYSLQDTAVHPRSFLIKAANSIHIKTRPIVIQNRLLFKKNEHYDSLLVNESVRLIRSQKYVRDVLLYTLATSRKADSVDVYIRVSDVWSIVPALSISNSSINAGLADNNLAGLGNRFEGNIQSNRTSHIYVKRFSYLIPNIRNSYISLNLQYMFPGQDDPAKNYEFVRSYYSPLSSNLQYLFSQNKDILRSMELSKSFYSPYTRWAGGLFLGQMLTAQSYLYNDTIRYLASKTNISDFWVARAWQISRWNRDGRITSFILSGRVVSTRYKGIPAAAAAAGANIFNKEDTYFTSIGITTRKYIQDQYIFNYGKIEDVPVGRAFAMTVGMDVKHTQRMYLGLHSSWGNVFNFGYLSTDLEYGTFIGSKGLQQGVITARINYYTRLINIKYWRLRQFIRPTLIYGINRQPSDNLTFMGEMKGFEKLEYTATRMLVLTLQTQSYSPWSLLGFNFGPYFFSSFGILGNESSGFSRSRIYSLFGLGVLVKNNYLTFSTFQISMTFYPYIPGNGYSIFKSNVYKTSDYGFRDFDISKPRVADY
jgi:hypothetical protein